VLSLALLGAALAGLVPARHPRNPELVGPGVISTPEDEFGFALTPDGQTVYFTKRTPTTNTRPRTVICSSHFRGGRWTEPEVAPFSGTYNDAGVAISRDGTRLVFASDRPRADEAARRTRDLDLWVVTRRDGRWSEPSDLGAPVNTSANESAPAFEPDGTLYFASNRPGGKGSADLYRARAVDGRYLEPENLAAINTEADETHPAISPDGRLLVFTSLGRADALAGPGAPYPRSDLYWSRSIDGSWTTPRRFDPPVDSPANESYPAFSPDGRWLYFASERGFAQVPMPGRLTANELERQLHSIENGWNNIYRVPTDALLDRPAAKPELFGAGVISTRDDEFGGQFSSDGRTLYFNKSVPRSQLYTIVIAHRERGGWTPPEIALFSGTWRDFDPTLSPDGARLFFISDRPLTPGIPRSRYNVWVVDLLSQELRTPRPLPGPINGAWGNHFASPAANGTLYFTSDRPGGQGPVDVWRARLAGDRYLEPENLGPAINRAGWLNLEAFVAPDESYLIVSAYGHDDALGDSDLYFSVQRDGQWQPLRHFGAGVNSPARDYSPRMTPDGRYLVFASERGVPTDARDRPWTYRELVAAIRAPRNGLGDLYRIELEAAIATLE
jgi:Tol biopolymer transport system component